MPESIARREENTMSEPTTSAPHPPGINERAPVVGASEIEIAADPEHVWRVLTEFERWPDWNPAVKSMSVRRPRLAETVGTVVPGTEFRWKAGPGTITSTIQRVEPPRLIAWTGKTLGIDAIHFWWLDPRDGKTFVRTKESYEGLVVRLFRSPLQRVLDKALADGSRYLKAEAERPMAG
jgi:hypothetical protein